VTLPDLELIARWLRVALQRSWAEEKVEDGQGDQERQSDDQVDT